MTLVRVDQPRFERVDRYAIYQKLATGGMATVHIARLLGPQGFSRVVAAKRMHPHLLENEDFRQMFLEEALLASRIRHPNVVPILDVLSRDGELIIVMEYVHGESLMALQRLGQRQFPVDIASAVMVGALEGLHAAHDARNEGGEPLGIVHRDVSPHNILVGVDGVARVVDFGIAKAIRARDETQPRVLKGKFSYIAPEVVRGEAPSPASDVFSAGVVFWELLAGTKLFKGATDEERLRAILAGERPAARGFNPSVPAELDRVLERALAQRPSRRPASALEFAMEIERAVKLAPSREVGAWVKKHAEGTLQRRTATIREVETAAIRPVAVDAQRALGPAQTDHTDLPIRAGSLRDGERTPAVPSRRWPRRAAVVAGVLLALAAVLVVALRAEAPPPVSSRQPAPAVAMARPALQVPAANGVAGTAPAGSPSAAVTATREGVSRMSAVGPRQAIVAAPTAAAVAAPTAAIVAAPTAAAVAAASGSAAVRAASSAGPRELDSQPPASQPVRHTRPIVPTKARSHAFLPSEL